MDTFTVICYEPDRLLKKYKPIALKTMEGFLVPLTQEAEEHLELEHLQTLFFPPMKVHNPVGNFCGVLNHAQEESFRNDKDHIVVFVSEPMYDNLFELAKRFSQYPAERPLSLVQCYPSSGRISFVEKDLIDNAKLYLLNIEVSAQGRTEYVISSLNKDEQHFLEHLELEEEAINN